MGIFIVLALLLCWLSILWGPAIYSFRRKGFPIKSKLVMATLVGQVILVVLLVVLAEVVGLLNPGGLILAFTIAVSVGGFFIIRWLCAKNI
ncbi:hypothetical protein [Microbulbifer sp. CNSA002]|uniref:hypothetical protein n=1 Tax=unclassified Microbulbifer TaxID=2619833 RepID=UPI0039B6CCF9